MVRDQAGKLLLAWAHRESTPWKQDETRSVAEWARPQIMQVGRGQQRMVDVRPDYAALLEQAVSLYVEAVGQEGECYWYDPRDPGICFICFHRVAIPVDSKVVEIWQTWVSEMLDRTTKVRGKSEEMRLTTLRREASKLREAGSS